VELFDFLHKFYTIFTQSKRQTIDKVDKVLLSHSQLVDKKAPKVCKPPLRRRSTTIPLFTTFRTWVRNEV